jgi:plasmid segregation protein ParM
MRSAIAIDIGHGWTKVLTGTGTRMRFPSLIAAAPPTVDLGEWSQSPIVSINDQPYVVGEAARPYATPLWSRSKATDADTLRLLWVAMAQVGATGSVQIATGLPLAWFGTQRQLFRQKLIGCSGTVQLPGAAPQVITIESAKILPQAVAGAIATWSHPVTVPDRSLVIDIGYRTTDFLVVQRAPRTPIDIALDGSGTIEQGMSAVAESVVAQLENQWHLPFPLGEVESVDTLSIRGTPVDLVPLREHARAILADRLVQELALRLKGQWDRMDTMVLLGGGSLALHEELAARLPSAVQVPVDPQWANVRGYLGAITEVVDSRREA